MNSKLRTIEFKICTKCNLSKSINNFHKKGNKTRSVCKECRKLERKEIYNKNKEQELNYGKLYKQNNPEKRKASVNKSAAKNYIWFRDLLNNIKNTPCIDCNKSFPPCAMDFDHIDPNNKLFNISEMQSRNELLLMQEINKCEIVCANCHRIREHNRRHKKLSYLSILINPFKDKLCNDCKIQYPLYVMDFDHINPEEKLFNLSKPPTQKDKQLILLEIEKCDVVCANCHRIRTFYKKEAA